MGSLTDDCGALGLAELRHHSPEPLDDRVLGTLPSVLAVVLRNALQPANMVWNRPCHSGDPHNETKSTGADSQFNIDARLATHTLLNLTPAHQPKPCVEWDNLG